MQGLSNVILLVFVEASRTLQSHVHFWWKIIKNERTHDILSLRKHSRTHNVSHLKALASKSICTKFLNPISCHSWEIRWFIFNELTVHSTRSPVKHGPNSKRKIFPDSGDRDLPSQACARKIWDIRAHPRVQLITGGAWSRKGTW
jgi:hypothetical protein